MSDREQAAGRMLTISEAALMVRPPPELREEFYRTFGVPYADFRDVLGGLDVVAFDRWLGGDEDSSTLERAERRFGCRAARLLVEMLGPFQIQGHHAIALDPLRGIHMRSTKSVALAPSVRPFFDDLRKVRFNRAEKRSEAENLLDVLEIVAVCTGIKASHLNGAGFRSSTLISELEALALRHALLTRRTRPPRAFRNRRPNYEPEIVAWQEQHDEAARDEAGDVLWIYRDPALLPQIESVVAGVQDCSDVLDYPPCCVKHHAEVGIRMGEAYVATLRRSYGTRDTAAIIRLMESDTQVDVGRSGPDHTFVESGARFPYVQFNACPSCISKPDSPAAKVHGKMRELAFALDREFAIQIWRTQLSERGIPFPSRNSPCPCASGEKFKRCCAA